jgi:hypothetical protein
MVGPGGKIPRWHVYVREGSSWSWTAGVVDQPDWALMAVVRGLRGAGEETRSVGVFDASPDKDDKVWRATLGGTLLVNPEGYSPAWNVYLLPHKSWEWVAAVMKTLPDDWGLHAIVRSLGMADDRSRKGIFTARFDEPIFVGVENLSGREPAFTIWSVRPDGTMEKTR